MISQKEVRKILSQGKPAPKNIPWYGEPNLGGFFNDEEINMVVKVMKESSDWSVGFSSKSDVIKKFEEKISRFCDAKYAITVSNCGAAIDLALRALELEPGDEVICPAINYKASHMAVIDRGAKIVFCEVDLITLNLDLSDVKKKISDKTRAIIPVSVTGLAVPVEEIEDLIKDIKHPKYGSPKIIVDAARSIGAKYNDNIVGKNGWVTCFSFHSQKLITTMGEGGALVTNDKTLATKVRDMCSYGGENGWGMNYRMSKIQAAMGLVQLDRLNENLIKRRNCAKKRTKYLNGIEQLILPKEPKNYYHIYYVYSILVIPEWSGKNRNKMLEILEDKFGIICSVTNRPVYERWPYIAKNCGVPYLPISDQIGERLFCPPLHPYLNKKQEKYICASIIETVNMLK